MNKSDTNLWVKYRIHIIAWLSFIAYETILVGLLSEKFNKAGAYVVHYTLNISFFYFHAHVVMKYILKNKATPLLPLGIALEIGVYLVLLYLINNGAANFPQTFGLQPVVMNYDFALRIIWRSLYFIGFSTGYYFLITLLKERERTAALEKQQLHQIIERQRMKQELGKAQNAYLRAQINPHFLFNTLNFIYNKTRKTAPVAADAILTLSAMMRYAVETSEDKGYILIDDEIEQIYNLIHLHRLRQNQQVYFNVEVEEHVRNFWIIPLILITLVENVFKHGNLSLVNHPAHIKIYIGGNILYIETYNLINAIHNASGLNKGLENIEKRLYHTYYENASFSYLKTPQNHFKTCIKIKVAALSGFASPLKVSEDIDK